MKNIDRLLFVLCFMANRSGVNISHFMEMVSLFFESGNPDHVVIGMRSLMQGIRDRRLQVMEKHIYEALLAKDKAELELHEAFVAVVKSPTSDNRDNYRRSFVAEHTATAVFNNLEQNRVAGIEYSNLEFYAKYAMDHLQNSFVGRSIGDYNYEDIFSFAVDAVVDGYSTSKQHRQEVRDWINGG